VIRLFLRTFVFVVVTLFLASLLSTLLSIVVAFVFDASVDTLIDLGWPLFIGCLLLVGVVVWRFLPIRRRAAETPRPPQEQ
jgi:hypothetical protein